MSVKALGLAHARYDPQPPRHPRAGFAAGLAILGLWLAALILSAAG
jgi:hypothetical protein